MHSFESTFKQMQRAQFAELLTGIEGRVLYLEGETAGCTPFLARTLAAHRLMPVNRHPEVCKKIQGALQEAGMQEALLQCDELESVIARQMPSSIAGIWFDLTSTSLSAEDCLAATRTLKTGGALCITLAVGHVSGSADDRVQDLEELLRGVMIGSESALEDVLAYAMRGRAGYRNMVFGYARKRDVVGEDMPYGRIDIAAPQKKVVRIDHDALPGRLIRLHNSEVVLVESQFGVPLTGTRREYLLRRSSGQTFSTELRHDGSPGAGTRFIFADKADEKLYWKRKATCEARHSDMTTNTICVAMKKRPLGTLRGATEEDKDDKEFVLAALERGDSLFFASKRLKGDVDVVRVAVSKNGHSLRHASETMRRDPELVKLADDTDLATP